MKLDKINLTGKKETIENYIQYDIFQNVLENIELYQLYLLQHQV